MPFCVLNALLVVTPYTASRTQSCRDWVLSDEGDPTIVVLVLLVSAMSLAFKLSSLREFPAIWAEHQALKGMALKMDETEIRS